MGDTWEQCLRSQCADERPPGWHLPINRVSSALCSLLSPDAGVCRSLAVPWQTVHLQASVMMQGLLASIQLSLPVSTLAVALAVLEQPVPCVPCMAPCVGCTRKDLPNLQCMTCTHVQG